MSDLTSFTRAQKAYIDDVVGDIMEDIFGYRLPPLPSTRWDYAKKPSRLNLRYGAKLAATAAQSANLKKKLEKTQCERSSNG